LYNYVDFDKNCITHRTMIRVCNEHIWTSKLCLIVIMAVNSREHLAVHLQKYLLWRYLFGISIISANFQPCQFLCSTHIWYLSETPSVCKKRF